MVLLGNTRLTVRYVVLEKYLINNLVVSHLGFWSGNFLIAPFPDHRLMLFFYLVLSSVLFYILF